MKSKLPDDTKLINLYREQKLSMAKIGARYGLTRQRVQQRLGELGVGSIGRRTALDPETLEQLFVRDRLSLDDISKKLGVSKDKLERELRINGIKRSKVLEHLVSTYSRDAVEKVYLPNGMTQITAARALGISINGFKDLLKHHGVTRRRHGTHSPAIPNEGMVDDE